MKKTMIILFLFSFSAYGFWPFNGEQEPKFTCRFENLGGTVPDDACMMRNYLAKFQRIVADQDNFQRTWIFYGPSGTGKTSAAKLISQESKATLHFYPVKNIVDNSKGTNNI